MKKYFVLWAALLVACTSCHRSSSVTCTGTVTVADSPGIYTLCGPSPATTTSPNNLTFTNAVFMTLTKPDPTVNAYDSACTITIVAAMGSPFTLVIQSAAGTRSASGVYTVPVRDTALNVFNETFSGRQYKISGGTITVLTADSSYVNGTFNLTVFNAAETKNITGTFSTTQPLYYY